VRISTSSACPRGGRSGARAHVSPSAAGKPCWAEPGPAKQPSLVRWYNGVNLPSLASDCLTATLPPRLLPGSRGQLGHLWHIWRGRNRAGVEAAEPARCAVPERPAPCGSSALTRLHRLAKGLPTAADLWESEWLAVRDGRGRQGHFSGACALGEAPAPLDTPPPPSSGSFPKEPLLGPKQGQSQTPAPAARAVTAMGTSGSGGVPGTSLSRSAAPAPARVCWGGLPKSAAPGAGGCCLSKSPEVIPFLSSTLPGFQCPISVWRRRNKVITKSSSRCQLHGLRLLPLPDGSSCNRTPQRLCSCLAIS